VQKYKIHLTQQVPWALPNFSPMKSEIFNFDSLGKLRELLQHADSIVITNHKNPDGDAMGSVLALYHFLRKWGYPSRIIVPNDYPEFLKWLPGQKEVLIYEGNQKEANDLIESADLIFALDYNALSRTGEMEEPLKAATGKKVLIDHHRDPADFADLVFSDITSCATAQMVFEMIENLELLELLDIDSATCLYTGLVTDTGSFRYSATTSKTHEVAAHLLEIGVENGLVHQNLFDNKTENVLKMRGHVLANNLVVLRDYKVAYITMSRSELEKFEAKSGDTEGLVNEALSIKGVVMAAFFKEDYNLIKISFRSIGDFPVNELSASWFNGGGHCNAAGGSSKETLQQTVERFIGVLPQYKEKLHATK